MNNPSFLYPLTLTLALLVLTACTSNNIEPDHLADFEDLQPQAFIESPTDSASSTQQRRFSTQEMIKRYQAILEIHDDPVVIAKVKRRIADLEMIAMEDEQFTDDVKDENETKPISYTAIIAHYQEVIKNNPNDAANENTLYQLAKAYDYEGQSKKSLVTLNQLIKQFPNSRYMDEVQYRRGDIYYSFKQYPQAYQAYNSLIMATSPEQKAQIKKTPYYINALYMQGWTLFKQGDYERSAELFSLVLDNTLANNKLDKVGVKQRAVVDDSLRILSVIFSYQNYGHSIASLYKKMGPRPYEKILYQQLSELLLTRDLKAQAIETNKTFIKHYPLHEEAPLFFARNIEIYQYSKDTLALQAAKDEYIKIFGLHSDYWGKTTKKNRNNLEPQLHIYLLEMASFHHGMAQALKNRNKGRSNKTINKEYALAISHYLQWLTLFPQHLEQGEKSYLLALAYEETEQRSLAIFWYQKSAYDEHEHAFSEKSAYAICTNLQTLLQRQKNDVDQRQMALLKTQAQIKFAWYFPKSPFIDALNINTMESFYQLKNYPSTIYQSQSLLLFKEDLTSAQQLHSWTLQAHSQFLLDHFFAAEQAYLQAALLSKTGSKQQKQLNERIANSIYLQAEYALSQDQITFALLHYHRLPFVSNVEEYRIKALFDEATYLLISHRYNESIVSLNQFRTRYPEHVLSPQISGKIIAAYEGNNDWAKAAQELSVVWKNTSDPEKKRLALYLSAEYYEKAELHDKALARYRSYAHQFPKPFDLNLETRFKLSETYKKKDNIEKREFWLQSLIDAEEKQSNVRSRHLAAMAKQYFADKSYDDYANIELLQPLEKSLTAKQKAFDRQLKAYQDVHAYESELYSAYAGFSIAVLYSTLAQSLLDSQRPADFDELELEEYQYALEDEAVPFEENAIAIHINNTQLVQQGIYNEWIKKSFKALQTLYPGKFNRPTRLIIDNERIY